MHHLEREGLLVVCPVVLHVRPVHVKLLPGERPLPVQISGAVGVAPGHLLVPLLAGQGLLPVRAVAVGIGVVEAVLAVGVLRRHRLLSAVDPHELALGERLIGEILLHRQRVLSVVDAGESRLRKRILEGRLSVPVEVVLIAIAVRESKLRRLRVILRREHGRL